MDIFKLILTQGKEIIETQAKRLKESRGSDFPQLFVKDLFEVIETQGRKLKDEVQKGLAKVQAGLAEETEQNREMLGIYARHTRGEADAAEMERANEQFRRFLKTLGIGALLVMPLSPITIPAVVRLGEKLGVDILPDWIKR